MRIGRNVPGERLHDDFRLPVGSKYRVVRWGKMMRKKVRAGRPGVMIVLAVTLLGLGTMMSAQVIENPAKPKAANAGRVVTPEEVLSISDEGTSDYFFKWPHGLKTTPDGSLIVIDRDQVLHFDQSGRFLRNLFKKGQGPGEMTYTSACLPTDKGVIIHSPYPNKLVFFGSSGTYEKEIPVREEGRTSLTALLHHAGTCYFQASEFPQTKGDPDYVDVPQTIVALNEAAGEIKKLATFLTRAFVVTSPGGGGGMFGITGLITIPVQEKLLALTHTSEYLLKIYDPAANKVVREFRRAYERVKQEPLTEEQKKGGLIIDGKHFTRPEQKFENDVKNVLARGDEIWAVTSTKDKAKGILIDVFDAEGVYRDSFYLKLPEAALKSVLSPGSCAFDGEFLWVVERSEDETVAIKKYRVVI